MLLDSADIAAFNAAKLSQWNAIAGSQPGLTLVRSGPYASSFMLVCSKDGFYEAVIIGQLAHRVPRAVGRGQSRHMVDTANDQKPVDKRGIDLTDKMIADVLGRWAKGQSAIDLDFVPGVWGRDGRLRIA